MKAHKILLPLLFLIGPKSWAQTEFHVENTVALERAKLMSLGICSHETNRSIVGGDPKKLSFFKFQIVERASYLVITGFCNSVQSHPSRPREKTEFSLTMTTAFPSDRAEGYDYGNIGSHKIRLRWTLENTNPVEDPEWKKFVQVKYHTFEFYFDLPLLNLWSSLNPLKIDIQNLSSGGLQGLALRNLRGLSVEQKTMGVYHLNYTNLEEYFRNTHSQESQAQGIAFSEKNQVYGCIYSSYSQDGSLEGMLDSKQCYELYSKARP